MYHYSIHVLQEYDSHVTVLTHCVTILWHRAGAWSVYAVTLFNEANNSRAYLGRAGRGGVESLRPNSHSNVNLSTPICPTSSS
jgi:hypothetical protein